MLLFHANDTDPKTVFWQENTDNRNTAQNPTTAKHYSQPASVQRIANQCYEKESYDTCHSTVAIFLANLLNSLNKYYPNGIPINIFIAHIQLYIYVHKFSSNSTPKSCEISMLASKTTPTNTEMPKS